MSHQPMPQSEVEDRLWKAIEHGQHTGMLGVSGGGHFQPMTAFVERESNTIWFFTYRDTDLAEAVQAGGRATFIVQQDDLWACLDGRISLDHDRARMDRFWNPHVAAWYPEGKDDPRLALLRLDCQEAGVWLSDAGPVKYAWEVAKANASKSTPDIGERRDINLH
jgi:general stress protein 26